MLKGLSEVAAIALSLLALPSVVEAGIPFPDQCWPDCQAWLEDQQCKAWFGQMFYYCGWANGYTYCCGGE